MCPSLTACLTACLPQERQERQGLGVAVEVVVPVLVAGGGVAVLMRGVGAGAWMRSVWR